MRTIDKVKFDELMAYIKNSDEYSLEKYMTKHGLLQGSKLQNGNMLVSCPHHSDSSPSMSVNLEYNIYRCFGCGRQGGYMKFVVEHQGTLGNAINVFSLAEQLLKDDITMRSVLEFNSLYRNAEAKLVLEDIEIRRPRRLKEYSPKTFIGISNKMCKEKRSVEDKVFMISLMQSGMSVDDVYASMYSNTSSRDLKSVDINSLLNEEEGDYDWQD